MVLVWYWYGIGMVLVWYWYGIGMVLVWFWYGLSRYFYGATGQNLLGVKVVTIYEIYVNMM
jgi:hypothetical protein